MWTIYHNQNCSKSNAALNVLTENNADYQIINYLDTPLSIEELTNICALLDNNIESMIRKKDDAFAAIRHAWEHADLTAKIKLLSDNLSLLERPIVVNPNQKAKIGRPDHTALLELFEE